MYRLCSLDLRDASVFLSVMMAQSEIATSVSTRKVSVSLHNTESLHSFIQDLLPSEFHS